MIRSLSRGLIRFSFLGRVRETAFMLLPRPLWALCSLVSDIQEPVQAFLGRPDPSRKYFLGTFASLGGIFGWLKNI